MSEPTGDAKEEALGGNRGIGKGRVRTPKGFEPGLPLQTLLWDILLNFDICQHWLIQMGWIHFLGSTSKKKSLPAPR